MRLLSLALLAPLAGCLSYDELDSGSLAGTTLGGGDTDGDTDADSDADADTDTDTNTETGNDGPWRLEEGARFTSEDVLDVGSPPSDDKRWEHGPGLAVADIDGDMDLDVIMSVAFGRSYGFRNVGGELEIDDTITMDGDVLPEATSVAMADLDGDGDADAILTGDTGDSDLILENDGTGAFTSHALPSSTGMSLSPSVGDMDGDGDLDIAIPGFNQDLSEENLSAGAKLGAGTKLWRNGGDLSFTDVTATKYPTSSVYDLTYHLQFLDFDLDGDLDLFQSNDFGGELQIPCELLENDGTGKFTALGSAAGSANAKIAAMGAGVGDANQDGYPDLWVSNFKNQNFLWSTAAAPGVYVDHGQDAGVQDPANGVSEIGWGARVEDLDGDLLTDLAVMFGPIKEDTPNISNEQPDLLYLGGGTAEDPTWTGADVGFGDAGIGRTLAHADIDRDGRGDLVVVGRTYLIVYYGRGGVRSATLHLDAGPMNHEGIGAQVVVTAGDRTYTNWMLPSVIFGSSAPEMYTGFNGQTSAAATITWPDGRVTTETLRPGDDLHLTP